MAAAAASQTEKAVVELIVQMYCNPQLAQHASQRLTEFQTSPDAWDICLSLLLRCAAKHMTPDAFAALTPRIPSRTVLLEKEPSPIPDEAAQDIVAFFAAQTICSLCQAGLEGVVAQHYAGAVQPGMDVHQHGLGEIRSLLLELMWLYRNLATSPAVRQLSQAVVATVLFSLRESCGGPLQDALPHAEQCIAELLYHLNRSGGMIPPMLDILAFLPADVNNRKLALTRKERFTIAQMILSQESQVFAAVAQVHDAASGGVALARMTPISLKAAGGTASPAASMNRSLPATATRRTVLMCLQSWLEAHSKFNRQWASVSTSDLEDSSLIPQDTSLLARTAVLPLALTNFHAEIQAALETAFASTPSMVAPAAFHLSPPDDPNLCLQQDLDIAYTPSNAVLSAACDTLTEALEFLYVTFACSPAAGADTTDEGGPAGDPTRGAPDALPLFDWANLGCLLALFDCLAETETLFRTCSQRLEEKLGLGTAFQRRGDQQVLPGIPSVLPALLPQAALKAFVVVMEKFGQAFFPAIIFMVYFDVLVDTLGGFDESPDAAEVFPHLSKEIIARRAQSLLGLMVDLLAHPCLELRHHGLDFWYSLMGNQFIQQHAQLEAVSGKCTTSTTPETILAPPLLPPSDDQQQAIVWPVFEALVSELLRLVLIPGNVSERMNDFAFGAWLKYRDACATNLTDVTTVLTCFPILKKAGPQLLDCVEMLKTTDVGRQPPWRQIEAALFVLSTIASRAQAGVDEYIPAAIESLPNLPYMEPGSIESFLISTAAARLMLWTAGYIGSQRELFAQSFQLLHSFTPQLTTLNKIAGPREAHPTAATQSDLALFRDFTECIMVEAMNAVVSAAATTLARDITVPESDITFVLNGLVELVLLTELTMESRCSLIVSAGAVLQCLPIEKMQKFHYHLVKALHDRATAALREKQGGRMTLSSEAVESLKLFFTALESVQPFDDVRVPPPSPNAVPLDRSSEFRHPVLNVLEEFWPLVERCLDECHGHEMLVESACHAVVRICSICQAHAIRYELFAKFFNALARSFQQSPTVFHLGALRAMLGIFGYRSEKPVHRILSECLLACTQLILSRMQAAGVAHYVQESPDLVGMTLDCTNTCLTSAYLTECLVQLTPECHHPKVLMTMLLVMTRFAAWFDPVAMKTGKEPYDAAINRCSDLVNRLAVQRNLVEQMMKSVICTVTEIFQGNAQWIGIAGTLVQQLLQAPLHATATRAALRSSLEERPPHIVPPSLAEDFCGLLDAASPLSHRAVCRCLQHLAEQAEANWQKSTFAAYGTIPAT